MELDVTATDDTVTFVVADRGPGVPESAAKRLFEKFGIDKRAAGTPRKDFGLGLCGVRLTAKAHGDRDRAQSCPGRDTEFQPELPRNGPPARAVEA